MEWQKDSISFDLMLSRNKLWGRTIVLHCRVEAWPIFLITNSFIFPKSFRISLANWEDHVPMAPIAYVIAFAMTERSPTTSLVSAKAGSPDHLVISLPDLAIFIQSTCRQDLRSLQVIVYMFRYVMLVNNCDYLFQSICYVVNKRFFTISVCFRSIETSLLDALWLVNSSTKAYTRRAFSTEVFRGSFDSQCLLQHL